MELLNFLHLDFNTVHGFAFLFITIVTQIIFIIANCLVFRKIGEKPYKALIPFYQEFVLFRALGVTRVIPAIYTAAVAVFIVITYIELPGFMISLILFLVNALIIVFYLIIYFQKAVKLSDYFGKGSAFKVGMVLFQPLFTMILAFGRSRYLKSEVS